MNHPSLVSMVNSGNYQFLRAADWVQYLSIKKKLYGSVSSVSCPFDTWDVDDRVFAMQWLPELIERCPRNVFESIGGKDWVDIYTHHWERKNEDVIRACAEKMPYSTENLAFVIAAGFGEFINVESISGKKWSEIICLKPECFRYCNLEKLSPVDWLEIYQVRVACFNEVSFAVKDKGAKRDCII
jgi:hypothetical protein